MFLLALAFWHLPPSRIRPCRFIKHFEEHRTICRKPGSGRLSSITAEIKALVEQQMQTDDETTAYQLHKQLTARGFKISVQTVLRCRKSLGWTFRGSAYCQLIRDVNKVKRLAWARDHLNDTFADVIWTDECSIQMESHRRFCCRKIGLAPKPKPRCKDPMICILLYLFYNSQAKASSKGARLGGYQYARKNVHLHI